MSDNDCEIVETYIPKQKTKYGITGGCVGVIENKSKKEGGLVIGARCGKDCRELFCSGHNHQWTCFLSSAERDHTVAFFGSLGKGEFPVSALLLVHRNVKRGWEKSLKTGEAEFAAQMDAQLAQSSLDAVAVAQQSFQMSQNIAASGA